LLDQLGKRIKEMRVKKEMTLKNLSDATGLSTGFISQLERGLTTISVDSLQKLSEALEVNLNYFFKTAVKRESVVLKRHQRSILAVENQFIYYQMSSDYSDKTLFPRMIELLPLKELEKLDSFSHEGEEFIYVIEGILTLVVDDEQYDLYPGETAHFDSTRSHNWYNSTNQLVKILAVSHPNRLADK
jgi:transcriptional regulator with XRE-family HTH domain